MIQIQYPNQKKIFIKDRVSVLLRYLRTLNLQSVIEEKKHEDQTLKDT